MINADKRIGGVVTDALGHEVARLVAFNVRGIFEHVRLVVMARTAKEERG